MVDGVDRNNESESKLVWEMKIAFAKLIFLNTVLVIAVERMNIGVEILVVIVAILIIEVAMINFVVKG